MLSDPSGHEQLYDVYTGAELADLNPLSGMVTLYGGEIVDPNNYGGWYATIDGNVAMIIAPPEEISAPPITTTPYQEPIVDFGAVGYARYDTGDPSFDMQTTIYPSRSQSALHRCSISKKLHRWSQLWAGLLSLGA